MVTDCIPLVVTPRCNASLQFKIDAKVGARVGITSNSDKNNKNDKNDSNDSNDQKDKIH